MKINHYKLKPNTTQEDLLAYGFRYGGNWVIDNADLFLTLEAEYKLLEYSITIAIDSSNMYFDDFNNVLVCDEDFGQPYLPFYTYYNTDVTDFDYLEVVIRRYNKWMNELKFLERVEENNAT